MEMDVAGATPAQVQAMISGAILAALPAASQQATARPLNIAFQPVGSATHDTICTYSIQLATTAVQTETAYLEIATDGAFTQNVQLLSEISFGALVATVTMVLTGVVPQTMWARIRTGGTGTATFVCGQEVAL